MGLSGTVKCINAECGKMVTYLIPYHIPLSSVSSIICHCKFCNTEFPITIQNSKPMEMDSELTKEEQEELTPDEKERIRKKKFIHAVKAIIAHEFSVERNKKRLMDKEKNMELVRQLGDALTSIEIGIKENLNHLEKGEDLSTIIPE